MDPSGKLSPVVELIYERNALNWFTRFLEAVKLAWSGRGAADDQPPLEVLDFDVVPKPVLFEASDDQSTLEMLDFIGADCDEAAFSALERRVKNRFGLYQRAENAGKRAAELKRLIVNPELAAIYIFHGDGFLREAALGTLKSPIEHSIVAYGVIRRLNDWSPIVRMAALTALTRCFRGSDSAVLMPAVWVVLKDARKWGRWKQEYAALLHEIVEHPQLCHHLVARLQSESGGGTSAVFQSLCEHPKMDGFLARIALSARQPHLRACALACIAANKVIWPLGRSRKLWVDKSLGAYKTVADYGSRPLSVKFDLAEILQAALHDSSAIVQRQVLDALSLHRHDPLVLPLVAEALEVLSNNKRPSIQNRLNFLKSHAPMLI